MTNTTAILKQPTAGARNALNQPTYTYADYATVSAWFTPVGQSEANRMLDGQRYDFELTYFDALDLMPTVGWQVSVNGKVYKVMTVKPSYTPAGIHHTILGLATIQG